MRKWFTRSLLSAAIAVAAAETPRVVAHRGNYQYDDNARGGFEQSLAAGVTGFETDVQMTSDGGFLAQENDGIVNWNGERCFTNTVPLTIGTALGGAEGLSKWGPGDLFLPAASTFTGDVFLGGGTTFLTLAGNDVNNPQQGSLGNPRVVRAVVVSNATVRMVGKNSFAGGGRSTTPVKTDLRLYDSTLDLTTNFAFNAGDVYLHDSVVKFHGGLNYWGSYDKVSGPGDAAFWGSFFANNLYFSGTKAVVFENELTDLSDRQYRNAGLSIGKFASDGRVDPAQQGIIDVPDMTGDSRSDVVLRVPLLWTSGANAPSSGFRKTGSGTLEFANLDDNRAARYSNYTGDVDVVEGTLKMSANFASLSYDRTSAFGAARYPHTVTVHPGATLQMAAADQMGQIYQTNAILLHVKGTYTQNNGAVNGLGRTIFENAAVSFGNGVSDANYWVVVSPSQTNQYPVSWPSVSFNQGVRFTGTNAYSLSNVNATYHFGEGNGERPTDIRVDDVTGDGAVDVTIGGTLVDAPPWYSRTWQADALGRRYRTSLLHAERPLNMRKTGAGTLLLNNTQSACTGRIEVAEGTLRLAKRGNSQYAATTSSLGNLALSNRVALAMTGGVLEFTASDTLGQASCVNFATFAVTNGTLRSKLQDAANPNAGGWANSLPFLDLYDANFDYDGGLNSGNADVPYGTFIFTQRVRWDGTRPYDLQPKGVGNAFALGYGNDFYAEPTTGTLTNWHGKGEFWVADITKDARPDVTIGVVLKTQATWAGGPRYGSTVRFRCGLLKTGAGTLRLNGTGVVPGWSVNSYYQEATRVNGGALLVDAQAFQSTNVFVQAGACVGGTGTLARVTVEAGGGFTAAPGQTRPLTVQAVELPADRAVRLDIPCMEDVSAVTALRVPVVTAAGLDDVKWTCTLNGGAAPAGYRVSALTANGVVYGVLARSGLTAIVR